MICQFSMTAVTNFYTLSDLKQKFILFTGLETRSPKFNKIVLPLGTLVENPFHSCFFQLLVVDSVFFLGVQLHHSNPCLHVHIYFSSVYLCVYICLFFSFIRTFQILFRAHPDKAGQCPQLKILNLIISAESLSK